MKELEQCCQEAAEVITEKHDGLPEDIKVQINEFLYPLMPDGMSLKEFDCCSYGLMLWLQKRHEVTYE